MQKLDEKKEYELDTIKQLIQDLVKKDIITMKEAMTIHAEDILTFTKSKIWKSMKTAKEIQKEKPFYLNISAKEIYQEEVEEEILVQGVIDLYYINENNQLVLVDYKTDFVKEEKQLIDKYKKQLDLYQRALEEALNRKVEARFIYSTYLGKEIKI